MKYLILVLFLPLVKATHGQQALPEVEFQTGFTTQAITQFNFSPRNNYLYAFNEFGEFILWDLRTAKQIKRITPWITDQASLKYNFVTDFSTDENYILIPDFPHGNFYLYSVAGDKIKIRFVPPGAADGEYYTHALFSKDGTKILLVALAAQNQEYCMLRLFDLSGTLLGQQQLQLPLLTFKYDALVRLIVGSRNMNYLAKTANILCLTASDNLEQIFFTSLNGKIYKVAFYPGFNSPKLVLSDFNSIRVLQYIPIITRFKYVDGYLVAATEQRYVKPEKKKDKILGVDTLFVIDWKSASVAKTVVSKYVVLPLNERSVSLPAHPMLSNNRLDVYFDVKEAGGINDEIMCRDLFSDRPLFSYKRGVPYFWYTQDDYKPGQLNGGYPVAVSDDHKFIAECTRELVIYDVGKTTVRESFSLLRGNLKLNQAVFLDSSRILIPKIYNDAFVLSLKNGAVHRLNAEIDCQDTARNGANSYFNMGNDAQIGLNNAALSSDKKNIILANYIPSDLCTQGDNKKIQVWDAGTLRLEKEYHFYDPEYTYFISAIPFSNKFLVNYKLVDFDATGMSSVKSLIITHKKDSFFAAKPFYLSRSRTLFAIAGTRVKPGDPDLIFAEWDLDGKLLKSYRYNRKKTDYEFQTFICEAQLSPDSSKLLFCLHDGTIGVFDIINNKLLRMYEHGEDLTNKVERRTGHTIALAGCFISDTEFVTAGSDSKIVLWSTERPEAVRVINPRNPVIIYGLELSPDKKYLYGVDIDKSVKFINFQTGNTDFRFAAFDYESYVLINKEGYYLSNKRSNKFLNFSYRGKAYEVSQFDLDLNRPDKVIATTAYADPKQVAYFKSAYEKRIRKLGYDFSSLNSQALNSVPELELIDLPGTLSTTDTSFTLKVHAKAKEFELDKLLVTVNGVPQFGSAGMKLPATVSNEIQLPVIIPLSNGRNDIVISVINKRGIESLKEYLSITRKGESRKPNLYVIAVGAGKYANAKMNLAYADKDAKDIGGLFDNQKSNYQAINITLLLNENVTRENILKLKKMLLDTRVDDKVVLFYAGHGLLTDSLDYFLATYDMDFLKPAKKGLRYEDIENLLDSIPARNKIMLIDACHSGEVDKENVRITSAATTESVPSKRGIAPGIKRKEEDTQASVDIANQLFGDLRRSNGATIIASAGGTEFAWEGDDYKNGFFTYCVLTGLKDRQADINKDGIIMISELQEYVSHKVAALTNGKQTPVTRKENLLTDIRVW